MKTARKLTALLMVVSLLCSLWAPMAVSAAVAQPTPASTAIDPIKAPLELLARLDNGQKLCAVYNQIVDCIQRGDEYVFFDGYTLSDEEQLILQTVVDATFPESYGDHIGHSYCTVSADYFHNWFYDWGLTIEMKDAVNQRVAELTADLYDKSDFDKSRILYERVVNENRYDFGEYHQTAYGALIEDKSVCAGYGRAYQALLQAVGIPCLYVTGLANNGYEIGGHAWNIVKLDGKWYYSDPTWDDHDDLYFGMDYRYFNITYTEISTDHFLDDGYEQWVPKEAATDANYYVHEGLVVETLTVDEMVALFKKHNPLPLRMQGDRAANAQAIMDTFFIHAGTIAEALGAPVGNISCMNAGDYSVIFLFLGLDHDHDYQYDITEPTCTQYGTTTYACQTCGDRGFFNPDPLGHAYGEREVTDTYHARYCLHCGEPGEYGEHTYEKDGLYCDTCGHQNPNGLQAGDVNGDGSVNNRDLGMVQRYLNGWAVEIDLTAADMNGDGTVNNRDLGLLQRYLNGWTDNA